MAERILIIGGDAAGMSAATRIVDAAADAELVVFERTPYTSYSACGIPMLVGGEITAGPDALVARSPAEHRRRGVDVRTNTEVVAVDLDRRRVTARHRLDGAEATHEFDQLMIATGGAPIRPDLPGIDLPFVRGVQTLQDGIDLYELAESGCRKVVIVGGGYIGIEMAEAFVHRGCTSTLVERRESLLSTMDADLTAPVLEGLAGSGVDVRVGTDVHGFEPGSVITDDGPIEADLVLLAIGVQPNTALVAGSGLTLGVRDAIRVDRRQATNIDGVWAAGDCAESTNLITGQPMYVSLGTIANKAGRTAGINMAGGDARTPCLLGTAITRAGTIEASLTGLTPGRAADAGIDALAETVESTTIAGYLPDAQPMQIRLTVRADDRRVIGGQIVGGPGAAMRINVIAAAITAGMTAGELADLDLAYAPPFSSVWDPVALAARRAK